MRKAITITLRQSVLLVILCWVSVVQAFEPLNLGTGMLSGINLAPYVHYTDSFSESDGIQKVLASDPAIWWPVEVENINFGLNRHPHWFLLDLNSQTDRRVYLEIAYALLNQVEVYVIENGRVAQSWMSGNNLPFSSRQIAHRNYVFPVALPANATTRIALRVQTQGSLQVPLALWDQMPFGSLISSP